MMATVLLLVTITIPAACQGSDSGPIYIGLDAEFGRKTGTADDAIKQGMLIAINEINLKGGLLGGRKLALKETDNRSVPARGIQNVKELAEMPDVVALFCGRFSTVVIETIDNVHKYGIPLLDPWAASDKIVDNGHTPNYVFRLSLRDSWAAPAMLSYAKSRGFRNIGLLIPNISWGRGNNEILNKTIPTYGMKNAGTQWYNYGETTLVDKYLALKKSGAEVVVFVGSETEGAVLAKEVAALPKKDRLPLISHWSITGSDFPALTGSALQSIDLAVVQTYSFIDAKGKKVGQVLAAAKNQFGKKSVAEIVSPVGLAHAYDLTHILALAITKAGTTDRQAVRNALEKVTNYDGLIKFYKQPFTENRHEALTQDDVFMARYAKDGTIVRIR
jgi:branched-chain amino acid transport system substrate-binding protein